MKVYLHKPEGMVEVPGDMTVEDKLYVTFREWNEAMGDIARLASERDKQKSRIVELEAELESLSKTASAAIDDWEKEKLRVEGLETHLTSAHKQAAKYFTALGEMEKLARQTIFSIDERSNNAAQVDAIRERGGLNNG